MLGFASFAAIVVVGSVSTSVSEINAEPCLIPVAHFLATGMYGNKCATAHSKLLCKPCRPLSVITLVIAACMTEFRQPIQVQSHLEMPRILVQLGHTQRT